MTIRHEELSARQRECHQKLQCLPKEEQLLLAALQKALLSGQVRAQSLKTVRQGKRKLDSSPDSPANQGVLGDCHHLAKKKTIALEVSACRESRLDRSAQLQRKLNTRPSCRKPPSHMVAGVQSTDSPGRWCLLLTCSTDDSACAHPPIMTNTSAHQIIIHLGCMCISMCLTLASVVFRSV